MLNHKQKWLRLIGWLMVLALIILSLVKPPPTNTNIPNSDKWLHLISYFTLSYWFFHTYDNHKTPVTAGFLFLGVTLEWLQSLTPHRYFEWLDMLMNVAGVLLGLLVFQLLKLRIKALIG